MTDKTYKAIIEDSSRNRWMFYYSDSSVCCKEISKDGIVKESVVANQVSDSFLTAIDLQDHIYVACINKDQGLYLFSYENNEWKLDQILNIQGSGSLYLLSLFVHNGSTHIIYAKQMTIANFYNLYHLYKPGSPNAYHLSTTWRKNNVGEIYAELIENAYSATITREGVLHLVNEWFDGNKYMINYSWYDTNNDVWKRKTVTSLSRKDIKVCILYEEGLLYLLCYTNEDEISAIFCYTKKENSNRDFEFYCLDKIKTEQAKTPYFHIESSVLYISWLNNNRFGQYSLNREQKNWSKKLDNQLSAQETPSVIEYIRNRKGRALVIRKTYFSIDIKNNISLPYYKDSSFEGAEMPDKINKVNDSEFAKYVPYILEELKSLTEIVKSLSLRVDKLENRTPQVKETSNSSTVSKADTESRYITAPSRGDTEDKNRSKENIRLKKSSFKEQFMTTNKLLNRPEATALYVGSSSLPNPEALAEKDGIEFAPNTAPEAPEKAIADHPAPATAVAPVAIPSPVPTPAPAPAVVVPVEAAPQKQEPDTAPKDVNLFKKIGDFFK